MRRLALLVIVVLLAAAMKLYATGTTEAPANFVLQDPPRPLPQIAIADGDGKAGSLPDFRGKFVLLNVWATWCVPCRKEMPTLDRLQGLLGGPDFQVIALSIDRGGAEVVRKFFAEIGVQHIAIHLDFSRRGLSDARRRWPANHGLDRSRGARGRPTHRSRRMGFAEDDRVSQVDRR